MLSLLLIVLALMIIVPVGLMAAAAWRMSRPARADIGLPPSDVPVAAVSFRSANGALIKGWHVPARDGCGSIALFHGVRSNRLAALDRMRFLHREGYGVLAIDMQAHGESQGAAITFGKRESADARAAIEWLRQQGGGPVGTIGASLGGAALLIGAAAPDVDAIVLEGVYPTIELAIRARLTTHLGALGRPFAPLFVHVGRWVTGIRPAELRPIDGMARLTMPILVMGGTRDTKTPIEETRAMAAAAKGDVTLWEVEEAGHEDLCAFAPRVYQARVLEFFARMRRKDDLRGRA